MTVRARDALLRLGVTTILAAGTVLSGSCESRAPVTPPEETATSPAPTTPPFRFRVAERDVIRSAPRRLSKRDRRLVDGLAANVRSMLTDLYREAFLDPQNWRVGTYDDAFDVFRGGAREEALRRVPVLTAGANAGQRFDTIEPIDGRVAIRVLLDRSGKPVLVATRVRFEARASGDAVTRIRSEGSYLFRRRDRAWRIVSFQVVRGDRPKGTT